MSADAPAVVILADEALVERRATGLLTRAGIAVELPRRAPKDRLLLILSAGGADERVDVIRSAAERRSGAPIVATLPDGAGSGALRRALRVGADGIVLDGELDRVLVPTLWAVLAGQLAVPPSLRRQLAPRHLSHREKQVLSLVVIGFTNRQIADELFLAESTIKTHLSSAFAKLDARSRAEAAAVMLDPEEAYHLSLVPVGGDVAASAA